MAVTVFVYDREFNEAISLKHLLPLQRKEHVRHGRVSSLTENFVRIVCILVPLALSIHRAGYLRLQTADVPQPH